MRRRPQARRRATGWEPIRNPADRYSSGITDFDRLLGGGFARGSLALFRVDETVGQEDLDLLLFPVYLNMLYQSRGIIAVLPSRDSPRGFRARLTRYVTVRRFDSRVRVVDHIGEDEGPPYVVSLRAPYGSVSAAQLAKIRAADVKKMEAAERAAQGERRRSFLEVSAVEVLETLVGPDTAMKMLFYGVKRARHVHNLVIGVLGTGLRCEPGVRRLADTEFELHHDAVGLTIRGIHPSFSERVVTSDLVAGPPHVAFVPRPP